MTADALPSPAEAAAHPICWAMLGSGGYWKPATHLWWIGEVLLDVFHGRTPLVCLSMPPRHSKSTTITTYFTSWFVGHRPTAEALVCAYAERLALGWSREARDAIARDGEAVFGLTANPNESPKEWFVRDAVTGRRTGVGQGGAFRAVGRGGVVTGRGFDIGVCDDLFRDAAEADSPTIRDSAWDFFVSAFLTRMSPTACALVNMTRWHHDDVIGRLMKMQKQKMDEGDPDWRPWLFINLPAIATEDDLRDERGVPQRREGEALWPERFPLYYLRGIRGGPGGPRNWQCLYQGRPTAADGDLFKLDWFEFFVEEGAELVGPTFRSRRENLVIYATLDLAFSLKTSADYTVCCVWGADLVQGVLYLLHLERERVGADRLAHWVRRVFADQGVRRGFVERSGFYADITRAMIIKERLPLREIQPNKDKLSRAQPAAALAASGRLLLKDSGWWDDLRDELLQFPSSEHDDQVDAVAHGVFVFNRLRNGRGGGGPWGGGGSETKGPWTGESRGGPWGRRA